ncbi:MAG: type II toxin-antitoxin system HicB family antitoxin [Roseiarcus sp.]
MRYAVKLSPDDDGTILVKVPDIPEAITFGEDRDDALARAVDAIGTAIIAAMAAREDAPPPQAVGSEAVALPALSAAKIELYRAMRRGRRQGGAGQAARRGAAADRPPARSPPRLPPQRHRTRLRFSRPFDDYRRQAGGVREGIAGSELGNF